MIIGTALASTLISACFFAVGTFVTHWAVILFKKWNDKKNKSKAQQQQAQAIINALQNMSADDLKKFQASVKAL